MDRGNCISGGKMCAPHYTVKSSVLNAWEGAYTVKVTVRFCLDLNLKQLLDYIELSGPSIFFFSLF